MAEKPRLLEVVSVVVGLLALILAAVSPFVVYRWLQNDVRVHRIKANSLRVSHAGASSMGAPKRDRNGKVKIDYAFTHVVTIHNEGTLPVGRVEAIIEYYGELTNPLGDVRVRAEPPAQFKKVIDGNVMFLELNSPIVPGEKVSFYFEQARSATSDPDTQITLDDTQIWIRSEASPAIPVFVRQEKFNVPSED